MVMPIKMNALVKSKSECGLCLADAPGPDVGVNDVVIRTHRANHCRNALSNGQTLKNYY
jgi:hypothetical protein